MPSLNVPPTKSSLLALRRQLAFAEEGYDLLEQKRQILVFELMSRLRRAREAEQAARTGLMGAFEALREATLDSGSRGLNRSALGVSLGHRVDVTAQHLMGLRLPRVTSAVCPAPFPLSPSDASANAESARRHFVDLLPVLAELAELQTAVARLSHELRKTQRRCNALSRIFIPDYRESIAYITASLEERERESFVILKMIRDRALG